VDRVARGAPLQIAADRSRLMIDAFDPRSYQPRADLLAGRIVLVTGAGDGIGRAVSVALARHGATVALAGRTVRKLERVYDEIVAAGLPRPALLPLDLEKAVAQDYDAAVLALEREFGKLDGLLHNASILIARSPIAHHDVPAWCRVLHVNLTAAFVLTQVCLPLLEKSTDASILFTTSGVGQRGRAYWGAYAVSKFGVEGLAQVLAHEYEGNPRVRVNLVNPGPVRTGMRALAYPAEDATRLVAPADITATYLYLLGPDASGVTGRRFDCQA
jgi:NAD(P)-dependent dehydrogenase (short-subunit alcohol dehydrogenase family)